MGVEPELCRPKPILQGSATEKRRVIIQNADIQNRPICSNIQGYSDFSNDTESYRTGVAPQIQRTRRPHLILETQKSSAQPDLLKTRALPFGEPNRCRQELLRIFNQPKCGLVIGKRRHSEACTLQNAEKHRRSFCSEESLVTDPSQ